MRFIESGIQVNIPDTLHPFRFEECQAYNQIKSQSVTEMDVGWVEDNQLYLVELKRLFDDNNPRYKEKKLDAGEVLEDYLEKFSLNVCHSVSMLAQNRSGTQACLGQPNFRFDDLKSVRAVFILVVRPSETQYLQIFQMQLNQNLQAAKAIFNLDNILVMTPEFAASLFPGRFQPENQVDR